MNPRVGSTRIVRVDEHNYAVEVFKEIETKVKGGDGKLVKTGETRTEWQDSGHYFGSRLDWAAESAIFVAMPVGEPITPDLLKKAVAEIVANTKADF